jgi:hypothetical protein
MSPVLASPSSFCIGVMRMARWLPGISSQKSSPSISTFWPGFGRALHQHQGAALGLREDAVAALLVRACHRRG